MNDELSESKCVVQKTYRIEYVYGKFLTYWNGVSAKHALEGCSQYYRIAKKRLVAKLEQ